MSQVITDAEKAAFLDRTVELLNCVKEGVVSMSEVLAGLQKLIDGDFDNAIVDLDADPFIPEGLFLKEHRKGGKRVFDPAQLSIYCSEEQRGAGRVVGVRLREELKELPVFNANLLDWLLLPENERLIPEEWQDKYVFFWGTIYEDENGDLFVRCLYCREGAWDSCEHALEEYLDCNDLSVVSAS